MILISDDSLGRFRSECAEWHYHECYGSSENAEAHTK